MLFEPERRGPVLGWTSAVAAYGAAVFPAILGSTEDKPISMNLFAVSATARVQACKQLWEVFAQLIRFLENCVKQLLKSRKSMITYFESCS